MVAVLVDGKLNILSLKVDRKGVLSEDPGKIVGNPSSNIDLTEGIPGRDAKEPSSIPIPTIDEPPRSTSKVSIEG